MSSNHLSTSWSSSSYKDNWVCSIFQVEERVKKGDEFDGIFEMHSTAVKHIYMVDAGLTFNSPYPLILRPQRQVDIILSFDFSARQSDETHPFKVSIVIIYRVFLNTRNITNNFLLRLNIYPIKWWWKYVYSAGSTLYILIKHNILYGVLTHFAVASL